MGTDQRRSKPFGWNVWTRIVYVHQAFSLAVLGSGLSTLLARGEQLHAWSTVAGLVLAVATVAAMVGVAKHQASSALLWLRLLLWAAVIRSAFSVLLLAGPSHGAMAGFVRSLILSEAVLIPLAIYWSRAIHGRYLASWRAA